MVIANPRNKENWSVQLPFGSLILLDMPFFGFVS
jgi:hypothetical protein